MNREIKFRAWQDNQMIYQTGALTSFERFFRVLGYKKEPSTLMQFTGLTDSKGVPIYEGDIFKHYRNSKTILTDFISKVEYSNEVAAFGYKATLFNAFSEFDELKEDFLNHIEVIGNIYEHPELLNQ